VANFLISQSTLGRTGLQVSNLALGTAALGIDYGLPGSVDFKRPAFDSSVSLVLHAFESGINFFDTAPAYGVAEDILGAALAGTSGTVIASKAAVTWSRDATRGDVIGTLRGSVERSLKRLARDRLDVLQLHSATEQDIQDDRLLRGLEALRQEGLTTATGATVYCEKAALSAIRSGVIDVVQVAFNILDQRASRCVFAEASRGGVALVLRSALLKGALTPRWRSLPEKLRGLQKAVAQIVETLGSGDCELPMAALRFCLGQVPPVASVLVGASNVAELDVALAAAAAGPLPPDLLSRMMSCAIEDEALCNPALWPVL
jgi:aryl-alcohol dehydrogenase-like predicted oxidoreductase